MDILFISDVMPHPLYHDARALLFYLAQQLSQRRHVIDLVCFHQRIAEIADIPRYERFFYSLQTFEHPALDWPLLEQRHENGDWVARKPEQAFSPAMWRAVRALIATKRYSAVQFIGTWPLYDSALLARSLPTVLTATSTLDVQPPTRHEHRYQQWMQAYEAEALRSFQYIGALDGDVLDGLARHEGLQPELAMFGVDIDYYVATGHDPDPPALCFGGDFEQPGLREAARLICERIFPAVQAQFPALRLYILGYNIPQRIRAYASPQIFVVPDPPDWRPYFELSSMYISPIQQRSGARQVILRAMAMQTPVIATAASLEGLVLQPRRDGIMAETPDAFQGAILTLLRDAETRRAMAQRAYDLVQTTYAWQAVALTYEARYQRLETRRKPSPLS